MLQGAVRLQQSCRKCFTKDMENDSDASEVKMKDICKTNNVNEVDEKEIQSNVEMEVEKMVIL